MASRFILATMVDPDGIPRAWAFGLRSELDAVVEEVRQQARLYATKKTVEGTTFPGELTLTIESVPLEA